MRRADVADRWLRAPRIGMGLLGVPSRQVGTARFTGKAAIPCLLVFGGWEENLGSAESRLTHYAGGLEVDLGGFVLPANTPRLESTSSPVARGIPSVRLVPFVWTISGPWVGWGTWCRFGREARGTSGFRSWRRLLVLGQQVGSLFWDPLIRFWKACGRVAFPN